MAGFTFEGYADRPRATAKTPEELRAQLAQDITAGRLDAPDPFKEVNRSIDAAQGVVFDPMSGASPLADAMAPTEAAPTNDDMINRALAMHEKRKSAAIQPQGPSPLTQQAQSFGGRARAATQEHQKGTQETARMIRDAYAGREDALRELAEMRADRSAVLAHREQEQIQDEQARRAVHLQERERIEQDVSEKRNVIESRMEALRSRNLDPDRIFKHRDGSTNYAKRVTATIAMALGAVGSALAGGENVAARIIMKQIDDDMRAQQGNIELERDAISQQRTNLQDLKESLGSLDAAYHADRAMRLDEHVRMMESIKSDYMGAEERLAMEDTIGQLSAESAASLQAANDSLYQSAQAGLGTEMQAASLAAQGAQRAPVLEAGEGIRFRSTATEEDKKQVQALKKTFVPMMNAIETLQELAAGGPSWNPTKEAIAEGALQSLLSMKNQMIGAGTMQEAEFDRAVKAYKNPTDVSLTNMVDLWAKVAGDAKRDFAKQVDGFNADFTGFSQGRDDGLGEGLR